MPFKSEAQRKFLWARHPEIAKRWAEEEKRGNPVTKKTARERETARRKKAYASSSSAERLRAISQAASGKPSGTARLTERKRIDAQMRAAKQRRRAATAAARKPPQPPTRQQRASKKATGRRKSFWEKIPGLSNLIKALGG